MSMDPGGSSLRETSAINSAKFRQHNERLALTALRRFKEASKAEVARALNLTPAASGNIIDDLERAGYIKQIGKRTGRRGPPSILYTLNPDRIFSIGIKIGRRSLEAVMIDLKGSERARREYDYSWPEPDLVSRAGNSALDEFLRMVDLMPQTDLCGIGIATPFFLGGWNSELGFPEDLEARWASTEVRSLFAEQRDLPVYVENDASAAALAELTFGDGGQLQDFMHISIDTFVGGGLVQNGRLQIGRHGNGAALGPLPVSPSAISPVPKGGTRLLHRASTYALLNELQRNGIHVDRVRDLENPPPGSALAISSWVNDCAAALAEAIVAIASIVDIRAIVIDSVLPTPLHLRLMNEVQLLFSRTNVTGIIPPAIIGGHFGEQAAPLGAATLPLAALFDVNSDVYFTGSEAQRARPAALSAARAKRGA